MFDRYYTYSSENDGDFVYNVYFKKECVGKIDVFVDEPMGPPTEKKPLNVVKICLDYLRTQKIKIEFESVTFLVPKEKSWDDESGILEFKNKLQKIGITFNVSEIKYM